MERESFQVIFISLFGLRFPLITMKKIILITVLIIGGIPITLFVVGMGIGVWRVATDQSTVDCSKDIKCLPKYMNTCTGTKIIVTQRDTPIKGIKQDFIVSAQQKTNEGKEICRVYMNNLLHKDQAMTSNMSASEIASIDKIIETRLWKYFAGKE